MLPLLGFFATTVCAVVTIVPFVITGVIIVVLFVATACAVVGFVHLVVTVVTVVCLFVTTVASGPTTGHRSQSANLIGPHSDNASAGRLQKSQWLLRLHSNQDGPVLPPRGCQPTQWPAHSAPRSGS